MESPRERACPRCTAPAAADQRWCLECGGELPGPRRSGLRPAVGIATTLAVLVGAASAGGYTLLQEDRQPPPPATTVAQAPAPAPETLPPATQSPAPYTPTPYTPATTTPGTSSSSSSTTAGGSSSSTRTGGATTGATRRHGSVEPTREEPARTTPPEPRFVVTDIALGAAAVVYAPDAPDTIDLGDPSRTVDGSIRTAWRAPAAEDPTAAPQVGVYVDLAGKEKVRKLVLRTPTPGMSIEVYGATSGPPAAITARGWDHLADRANIAEQAKIRLPEQPYRYLLVWIAAGPPDGARPAIAELSLLSLQPE
jgi:hypothetical protein